MYMPPCQPRRTCTQEITGRAYLKQTNRRGLDLEQASQWSRLGHPGGQDRTSCNVCWVCATPDTGVYHASSSSSSSSGGDQALRQLLHITCRVIRREGVSHLTSRCHTWEGKGTSNGTGGFGIILCY